MVHYTNFHEILFIFEQEVGLVMAQTFHMKMI